MLSLLSCMSESSISRTFVSADLASEGLVTFANACKLISYLQVKESLPPTQKGLHTPPDQVDNLCVHPLRDDSCAKFQNNR